MICFSHIRLKRIIRIIKALKQVRIKTKYHSENIRSLILITTFCSNDGRKKYKTK